MGFVMAHRQRDESSFDPGPGPLPASTRYASAERSAPIFRRTPARPRRPARLSPDSPARRPSSVSDTRITALPDAVSDPAHSSGNRGRLVNAHAGTA
ncbi:hypothetical protein HBB16_12320 [Pseudonocardia sp. MCCB 268]|nr:hypothetical protein [Pseudonocardia cytotoxica]